MNYVETIQGLGDDAQQIESFFRSAQRAGEDRKFVQAMRQLSLQAPQNLLYAAWRYRLETEESAEATAHPAAKSGVDARRIWQVAILVSILNGLLFWLLSDFERVTVLGGTPLFPLVWAPIYVVLLMALLVFVGGRQATRRWLALTGVLAVAVAYAIGLVWWQGDRRMESQGSVLLLIHLPALAFFAMGFFVLRNDRSPLARFAALIKAIEIVITAGLFLAAGLLFTGVTFGLFQAISIDPPDWMVRLFVAGGVGLAPALAVAASYQPDLPPQQQAFRQGLSRLIALVLRVLLPLALAVAVVYVALIPFYFWQPFRNRDTLIAYNAMLFAVLGLIVGATPVYEEFVPVALRPWLRRGLVALAGFALLVAIYAMSAVVYRTWMAGFTPNRVTVIGWNLVNIGILSQLLYRQWRASAADWLAALQATVYNGLNWYVVWTIVLFLLVGWLR
jgi:hypothetical protein